MVGVENKRKSFVEAWDNMTSKQQRKFKAAYLNKGYAISTFYNDKSGVSNIPEERVEFIESVMKELKVNDVWDK